jgi:hypothetical protein
MVVSACVESASRRSLIRLFGIGRLELLHFIRHDVRALEASPLWILVLLDELIFLCTFLQLVFVLGIWRCDVENFSIVFHQVFNGLHFLVVQSVLDIV